MIDPRVEQVVIGVNGQVPDGQDLSWLWDVDFSAVKQPGRRVVACGERGADLAVRLEYAGVHCDLVPLPMDALAACEPGRVEMLLNYRATFEDVEGRAVEADDYVTVDLKAVENADNFAAEGRMLIAGSDSNPAEFNEALIGANVDDVKTVTWTDEVEEGEEAETHTVEVTVKGIKVRNTPELTDELVKSDFGFDSIDAMRDAIKLEIEQDKASRLPAEKENRCVSALAERLQLDEMDADYEQSVFEELGQNFLSNLAARGMTLDTWLPASGLTMEQFIGDLHKQANDVARESLALDALARELKIEVTEDDINAEFEKAGVKDVEASKAEFIADGRMPAVRESIRRSKAVDHLVENAKVTEVDETAKDAE